MVSNPFFNNYNSQGEQKLIEDLVVESLKIYGHDVFYLPRTTIGHDDILNENQSSRYDDTYQIEMYFKSFDSFRGDGNFLSKFGLEVRDQIIATISFRSFENDISSVTDLTRPREGDCIFVPMTGGLYTINYVETTAIFYQMGQLTTYDLTLELFEYSNEVFATGISEIDDKYNIYFDDTSEDSITTESGTALKTFDNDIIIAELYQPDPEDIFDDSSVFETEADAILDFTEKDPFSEGGTF